MEGYFVSDADESMVGSSKIATAGSNDCVKSTPRPGVSLMTFVTFTVTVVAAVRCQLDTSTEYDDFLSQF